LFAAGDKISVWRVGSWIPIVKSNFAWNADIDKSGYIQNLAVSPDSKTLFVIYRTIIRGSRLGKTITELISYDINSGKINYRIPVAGNAAQMSSVSDLMVISPQKRPIILSWTEYSPQPINEGLKYSVKIGMFDIDKGTLEKFIDNAQSTQVSALSLSPDGNYILSGTTDGEIKPLSGQFRKSSLVDDPIRIWDPNSGNLLKELRPVAYAVNSLYFLGEKGSIISCYTDHKSKNIFTLWNEIQKNQLIIR
jgi:WD40 repeat protein